MSWLDPFPRRTATPARLWPWLWELATSIDGLVSSYVPGRPLDATTRERVIMAVTEVNGCRYCAWIHGSWQDFLGDDGRADAEAALLAYARACADAGRPLDATPLHDSLPPDAVRAVRATVAQIEISNLVGNTVDGLIARVTRKRPFEPVRTIEELSVVAAAAPIALPLVAMAGMLRAVGRAAPALPAAHIGDPGQANLLVHLLAEAAPSILRNAVVRAVVLGSPVIVNAGIQAGRTAATVRIGRQTLSIENGIAPDAHFVVRGDVESLLRLATGDFTRGLGDIRISPQ